MRYRAEIDGLRAVAVTSVLLFHAGVPGFSGGFVGVDIFFVISGYLITSIIAEEIHTRTFSFTKFYKRRARRLVPPFVPVLAFTVMASLVLMNESELKAFRGSVFAALTFSSNWFFFSSVQYFGGPGQQTPLLHLWSLAIEEQFYILFPPLLLLLFRRRCSVALSVVVASIWAVSLMYGLALVGLGRMDLAFFDSFARFWELITGCLLALSSSRLANLRASSATALELLGSLLILVAIFCFREGIPFPGAAALIPVLGAASVIAADGRGPITPLLSSRLMVGLGLISYALYLWHWPLLAVIHIIEPQSSIAARCAGLGVAVGLAIASYFLIERPIRSKVVLSGTRSVFGFVMIVAIAAASLMTISTTGTLAGLRQASLFYVRKNMYGDVSSQMVLRIEEERAHYLLALNKNFTGSEAKFDRFRYNEYTCSFDESNTYDRVLDCLVQQIAGRRTVLTIGDSIGRDATYALRRAFPHSNLVMLHQSGCVPSDGTVGQKRCFPDLDRMLNYIAADGHVDMVVFAFRYRNREWTRAREAISLAASLFPNVQLIGPTPLLKSSLDDLVKSTPLASAVPNAVSVEQLANDLAGIRTDAAELASKLGVHFIDVEDFWCPGGMCELWLNDIAKSPKFIDGQHLTDMAISRYSQFFRTVTNLTSAAAEE